MQHRGPDSCGSVSLPGVYLGHTRLSVIDLDKRSSQPFTDKYGRTLVFNGEIYNYRELRKTLLPEYVFHTTSDTEVILAAWNKWGASCVKHFVGDWAFALFDSLTESITLSRDRLGVKPLYYATQSSGEFIFASEAKALFEAGVPREVTLSSIGEFIRRGKIELDNSSLFNGVAALKPAHNLTIDKNGNVNEYEYWGDSDIFGATVPPDYGDAVDQFGELFTDSVKLRMHADVPVGICLSGGLDSSLITAVANQCNSNPLFTYSGVAPGWKGDESKYSDKVSSWLKTKHTQINLKIEDFFQALPRYVWAQEAPSGGVSPVARMLVLERAAGDVTVLLDGQGGDELLAGYTRFHEVYRQEWPHLTLDSEQRAKQPKSTIPTLSEFETDFDLQIHTLPNRQARSNLDLDSVTSMQYAALRGPGLLSLLHTEDRLTMAKSLEGRVPFLDHRLVEFCFSAPLEFRISGIDKRLIRSFASRNNLLPDSICNRRDKLGFATPYSEMIRTPMGFEATKNLIDNCTETTPGILNRETMYKLLAEHQSGKIDLSKRIFRDLTLLMWIDIFKLNIIH